MSEPAEPEGDIAWHQAELRASRKRINALTYQLTQARLNGAPGPQSDLFPPSALAWAVPNPHLGRVDLNLKFWQGEVAIGLYAPQVEELGRQLAEALAALEAAQS